MNDGDQYLNLGKRFDLEQVDDWAYKMLGFVGKIKYNYNIFMNKYFPKREPTLADEISMNVTAKSLEWMFKEKEIE